MSLPTWLQFFLTLAGGFILGLATAYVAVFRRLNRQEAEVRDTARRLADAELPRMEQRLQSTERTLYGRRGEVGLAQRFDAMESGIEQVKRILSRIADKLEVELPSDF